MPYTPAPTLLCLTCNRELQQHIYDSAVLPNLLAMLSAFIVLGILIVVFSRRATRSRTGIHPPGSHPAARSNVPLTSASIVLGMGLGGFADGIVLHQILQWHEMLTNRIPPDTVLAKSVNMFWDGIFHLFTLLTTTVGVWLLWKVLQREDINRSQRLLWGGILLGWGIFNLVEGIIDHHILKLHNVREITGSRDAWNYGFLVFGLLQLLLGWLMTRRRRRVR